MGGFKLKITKYNATLQIRIDKDLKNKAEKIILKKYNQSLSEFIRKKIEEVLK